MSRNLFLAIIIVVATGLWFLGPASDTEETRAPANVTVLHPTPGIDYDKLKKSLVARSQYQKVKGAVQIDVEILDGIEQDQPFRVLATIHTQRDLTNPKINWTLSENLEVVSGSASDTLNSINKGEKKNVEISLSSKTAVGHSKIYVHLTYEEGGKVYKQTGYFNTKFHGSKSNNKSFATGGSKHPDADAERRRLGVIY